MSEEYSLSIAEQDARILRMARIEYQGPETDIGNYIHKRMPKPQSSFSREYLVNTYHSILMECYEKIKKKIPIKE
jgi:hypothetical protein